MSGEAHDRRGEKAADQPPEDITGGGGFTPGDRAIMLPRPSGAYGGGTAFSAEPEGPPSFSQGVARSNSGKMPDLANLALFGGADVDGMDHQYAGICPAVSQVKKGNRGSDLVGLKMHELGLRVHLKHLEVLQLRSSTTGERNIKDIFPLPTSKSFLVSLFPLFDDGCIHWLLAVCLSLNSMWGGNLHFNGKVSKVASECLHLLAKEAARLFKMECRFESFVGMIFSTPEGLVTTVMKLRLLGVLDGRISVLRCLPRLEGSHWKVFALWGPSIMLNTLIPTPKAGTPGTWHGLQG